MSHRAPDSQSPACLLHVPRSAGSSMHAALLEALPAGSVAPQRGDLPGLRIFTEFSDFDRFGDSIPHSVALNEAAVDSMRTYRAVAGHFVLDSLLRITSPSRIITVLREPRARLLSLYLYFRLDKPVRDLWEMLDSPVVPAAMQPLDVFLSDTAIARATDNQVCRMLLDGDSRIPAEGFIDPAGAGDLAAAALDRLAGLGAVEIMESGADVWTSFSRLVGVPLTPVRVNATGMRAIHSPGLPVPPLDRDSTLGLLAQRCAADRVVYETILARNRGTRDGASQLANAAFAEQLQHFNSFTASRS